MMKKAVIVGLAAGLGLSASALASDQPGTAADEWLEEGTDAMDMGLDGGGNPDAGAFLADANVTRGAGPLNIIRGVQFSSNSPHSWDLFQIQITDEASFSATLTSAPYPAFNDPELWMALFDGAGNAVTFENDITGATPLTSANVTANGVYYLAVGGTGTIGATSFGESLFPWQSAAGEYAPNAASGTVLDQYVGASGLVRFNGRFSYEVTLTGAGYATVPTAGTSALLAAGGLLALRRRR